MDPIASWPTRWPMASCSAAGRRAPSRHRLRRHGHVRGSQGPCLHRRRRPATPRFRDSWSPISSGRRCTSGGFAAVATALAIGLVTRRRRLRFDTSVGVLLAGTFAFGSAFQHDQGYVRICSVPSGQRSRIGWGTSSGRDSRGYCPGHRALNPKELLFATFDPRARARPDCRSPAWSTAPGPPRSDDRRQHPAVGIIMVVAMLVTPRRRPSAGHPLRSDDGGRCRPGRHIRRPRPVFSFYLNLAQGVDRPRRTVLLSSLSWSDRRPDAVEGSPAGRSSAFLIIRRGRE